MRKRIPDIDMVKLKGIIPKLIFKKNSTCWIWGDKLDISGYGTISIMSEKFKAHRVVYSIFKGELDRSKVLDHICKNRNCVNPDHLREVSEADNVLNNSNSNQARNIIKTHCIRGHEFSFKNTLINKRKTGITRRCKKCNKIRYLKNKKTIGII